MSRRPQSDSLKTYKKPWPNSHPRQLLLPNMKLLKLFTTTMCVLGVAAQRSFIETPVAGATVSVGKEFTVQLVRPVRIPPQSFSPTA